MVLDHTQRWPDRIVPVAAMVGAAHDTPAAAILRKSLRRAVDRLADDGLVRKWWLLLPTRLLHFDTPYGAVVGPAVDRWQVCVSSLKVEELTEDLYELARVGMRDEAFPAR
jgi:hypothetical protein